MVTFNCLPNDVLLNIIDSVDQIRDLAALSTQCRHLYQLIDLPTRHQYHQIRLSTLETTAHAYTLLIDILKRPRLGSYLRQLEIKKPRLGSSFHQLEINKQLGITLRSRNPEENAENDKLLSAAMIAAGFSGEEKTLSGSTLAMLLITVCPNIRFLGIHDTPEYPLENILMEANAKDSVSRYLQNLWEVQVLVDDSENGKRSYNPVRLMEMMTLFHRLPLIQTVRVTGAGIDQEARQKLATGKSNVNKIIIEHSAVHTDDLRQIMRHPKALEVLKYGTGGHFWTSVMYHYNIFPKELGRSLQQHKSTLRVLDFDLDNEIDWLPPAIDDPMEVENLHLDRGSPGYDSDLDNEDIMDHTRNTNLQDLTSPPRKFGSTIGSLHDFKALTHLSIGIMLFAGPDIRARLLFEENYPQSPFRFIDSLPTSLEFLCIRGYREGEDEYHTSVVSEFMEKKTERFPRLKEVQGILEYIPSAKDGRMRMAG